MITKTGSAKWQGNIREGKGEVSTQSGVLSHQPYSFATRFEDKAGTNPEELIGAAHAGCYSMFLSALLTTNGTPPARVHTSATVHLTAGPTISKIELNCEADVPGLDADRFQELALEAKAKCPVSKALAAVNEVVLTATLL